MLNPQNLRPGEEQYEVFTSRIGRKSKRMVQYDYRDNDGTLFSCVRHTLEDCRNARNIWLDNK